MCGQGKRARVQRITRLPLNGGQPCPPFKALFEVLSCPGLPACPSPLPKCENHQQDNRETDVDCGGSTCLQRCPSGFQCELDGDCSENHLCSNGRCVPSTNEVPLEFFHEVNDTTSGRRMQQIGDQLYPSYGVRLFLLIEANRTSFVNQTAVQAYERSLQASVAQMLDLRPTQQVQVRTTRLAVASTVDLDPSYSVPVSLWANGPVIATVEIVTRDAVPMGSDLTVARRRFAFHLAQRLSINQVWMLHRAYLDLLVHVPEAGEGFSFASAPQIMTKFEPVSGKASDDDVTQSTKGAVTVGVVFVVVLAVVAVAGVFVFRRCSKKKPQRPAGQQQSGGAPATAPPPPPSSAVDRSQV